MICSVCGKNTKSGYHYCAAKRSHSSKTLLCRNCGKTCRHCGCVFCSKHMKRHKC